MPTDPVCPRCGEPLPSGEPNCPYCAGQSRRGGITAAGRKRLSQMMKQRWAAKQKQAKTA